MKGKSTVISAMFGYLSSKNEAGIDIHLINNNQDFIFIFIKKIQMLTKY